MHDSTWIFEKIKKFLKELHSMQPPLAYKNLSKDLLDFAKKGINLNAEKENFVVLGYHVFDISPHHVYLEPDKKDSYFFINMIYLEFLADILMYEEYRTDTTGIYLFSKYMRFFTACEGLQGYADFFQWLYLNHSDKLEKEAHRFVVPAFSGIMFALMHEYMHLQSSFLNATRDLFLSNESMESALKQNGKLDEDVIKETSCDFTALVSCSDIDIGSVFGLSKIEFLEVAVISLFLPDFYSYLSKLVDLCKENDPCLDIDDMVKKLQSRIVALGVAVKISQNTKFYFEDGMIESALKKLTVFVHYIRWLGNFLMNDYIPYIESFNSLPDIEREQYRFESTFSDWMLFA